jgi:hypothetical protein
MAKSQARAIYAGTRPKIWLNMREVTGRPEMNMDRSVIGCMLQLMPARSNFTGVVYATAPLLLGLPGTST